MKFFLLPLIFLITGCSTLSNTTNYEINHGKNLSRTYIHDWCEESQYSFGVFGTQCSGVYSPPAYSYSNGVDIYVFYPLFINHNNVSVGPLVAPIFPVRNNHHKGLTYYKIRSLHKGGEITTSPLKVSIYIDGIENSSCVLKKQNSDVISDVFTCYLKIETDRIKEFDSVLTFSDGTTINIGYTKKKFWSYRPIIAPAGKTGNTGKYIKIED